MKVYHHTLSHVPMGALPKLDLVRNPKDAECILVTGGDGSILHSLGFLIQHDITHLPVLGFNTGHVGFLSNDLVKEELVNLLGDIETLYQLVEERTVLMSFMNQGARLFALNDFVFQTLRYGKLFEVEVVIDDKHLLTYKGDGVILSTASGSTAYNLTAGGPIIDPSMETTTITPICPFTLAARSIVLKNTAKLKVTPKEACALSYDGNVVTLQGTATVTAADFKIKLVKTAKFYDAIEHKLGWNRGIR